MTSWFHGLVPAPVKRAFNALYSGGEHQDTALQASPPAAPLSPEQTVAPAHAPTIPISAASPLNSCPSPPLLPDRNGMPSLGIDSDSSCSEEDVPAPYARRTNAGHRHAPRLRCPSQAPRLPLRNNTPAPRYVGHSQIPSDTNASDDDPVDVPCPPRNFSPPRRRHFRDHMPEPRHSKPATSVSWRQWVGSAPPGEAATHPNVPLSPMSPIRAATALLQHVDTTIVQDGSYSNKIMGLGFVSHHHRTLCTRFFARRIEPSSEDSSMLAETLSLETALVDARSNNSISIHIVTDSRTLRQLVLGRERSKGPDKVGRALADAIQRVIGLVRTFDTVYVSHVRSHNKILQENDLADLLAGLASEQALYLDELVAPVDIPRFLVALNALKTPRNSRRATTLPVLSHQSSCCGACHCPSHSTASCFLRAIESFPALSIYCKKQPERPPTFSGQLCDLPSIDWDNAPACISYSDFTRFFTTCVNSLRRQEHADSALHALHMFASTYRMVNGHISRYKRSRNPPVSNLIRESEDHYNQLAANAKTAARLARDLKFHDAMKMLDRQQPVRPLCPEARQQLPSLYPQQVTDARVPPSSPGGRVSFDRHDVHAYVKSRSATSSPGISGFGFNWIQLFARLTIALETDQVEDPNWTIFLAFIEDFAYGELPWLRNWATDLKGALFNKNPDPSDKLRNLGIAESFVRIAAYMVMTASLAAAREKGLISEFDFGVAVPGGCEKFVKAAQAAASAGCTLVSCDLEKAFNNVLRKNLWSTVQFLQCPLLTSWFCFFYHTHPRVHFAIDPLSPFNMNNVTSYTLFEGVAQGDPLSSFLFVCTLSYILRDHRNIFPSFIRTTVIDDICFISAPENSSLVPSALNLLSDILLAHNLRLNKPKTTLYCETAFSFPTPPSFPYATSHHGFAVCRVRVGTPAFCDRDIAARLLNVTTAEESFTRLHRALDFCQTKGRGLIFIDLLRLCFRSRFAWDVRVLQPPSAILIANAADDALKRLLRLALPRHPLPSLPPEWAYLYRIHDIEINLPLVKGGLGLRSWASLVDVAHFSAWVESAPRVLRLFQLLRMQLPPSITDSIGSSVASLSARFNMPASYWHISARRARSKVQHELTEQLDAVETAEALSIAKDPAVAAQFLGSILPSMSLPFNSCLIPRFILDSLDNYSFTYALAWHTMLPLFPPSVCSCKQSWDPLGLHAAACVHLNAYNLLHNAVRDCFAGAARKCVSTDADSQVSYILTDKFAKSATWIHGFYPLKANAPAILLKDDVHRRPAPSLSPDVIIAFNNDPLHPYFGDFVASSPSITNRLRHGEAAQIKFTEKLQLYSKHHDYPSRVFYPLAFERSGYLHPTFDDFIDLFSRCSSSTPQPHTALQLKFAVAFAITFTTAALLRSASQRLLPRSLMPFVAPRPLTVPLCWAPFIASTFSQSSLRRRRFTAFNSVSHSFDSASLLDSSPNHPTTSSTTTSAIHTQTAPLHPLAAGHLSVDTQATGNAAGGAAVTLAAWPLLLPTVAASVIIPDRAPAARRSSMVQSALSSDGPAEQTLGRPQVELR
jgi:ribonuclease HI